MSIQGEARQVLTRQMDAAYFSAAYWLKSELQDFCRQNGLSASGGKQEIAARTETFLRTGKRVEARLAKTPTGRAAQRFNRSGKSSFTMQTRVPTGAKCTQEMRWFFQEHLGDRFRFTVTLQNFIKKNPGVTFQETADAWKSQEARRRQGWRPEIGPQFEFNQFTRDFYADPANRGKSRADCLNAWKEARLRSGEHKYLPEK